MKSQVEFTTMEDNSDSGARFQPFDLPMYTPEYKQRGSQDTIFRNSDASWCGFPNF